VLESDREFDYNAMRDARDYDRAVRENERDFAEAQRINDRNYYRDVLENDRNFAENQRQYDTDNRYRYDTFNWQQATDQRDFEESVRQNEQNYAYKYVTAILANGQMPSRDLLAAAGLSEADARLLMAQMQASGGVGGAAALAAEEPKSYVKNEGTYYDVSNKYGNLTTANATTSVPKGSPVTKVSTDNKTTAQATQKTATNAQNASSNKNTSKTSSTGGSLSTASTNKATNSLLQKAKKLVTGK
jgi:hypothetical protein